MYLQLKNDSDADNCNSIRNNSHDIVILPEKEEDSNDEGSIVAVGENEIIFLKL